VEIAREAPDVVIDLEHRYCSPGCQMVALPNVEGIPQPHLLRQTKLVMILHELVNNLRRYGEIYDEWYVMRLILEDGGLRAL